MGLLDLFFKNRPKEPDARLEQTFKMLNGYVPKFTSFSGGLYESELVRSAINAIAVHCSKLKVEMFGSARQDLKTRLQHAPNQLQTWSQFLGRLATLLEVHNTAFITPTFNEYGGVTGIFTPLPVRCEVVQFDGRPWLRYEFSNGNRAAIELDLCGIVVQKQYKNDMMGENNAALLPTMELVNIQNQGIQEGVKSAATYRFWARINNFLKTEDLAEERKRFTKENFAEDSEGGGVLLFPNTYTDVHQVDTKPWVVDAEQVKIIKENVFEYFGVNEKILTNQAYGDEWSAFYEGKIEPFALQLSEVLTKMTYTLREQSQGNKFMVTANRIQYMSNQDKLNVSTQLVDRGLMSINDAREIWNLPPVDGGDKRIIRGEYYEADKKLEDEQ